MDIKQLDKKYIAETYARFPLLLEKGNGAKVYDENGKEYIDMGSGIAVNIFGYCDKTWQKAVTAQLSKLQHTSNLFYSEPCAMLAEKLCEKTGMEKVFFSNSGAEANECAIKAARKYAADKFGADCYTIITLKNSFHGRTVTTLAATGQDAFHKDFLPLTDGFVYAEANSLKSVRKLLKENKCAAIMFESVQGEGGVIALDKKFVHGLAEIAEKTGVLLIADEVQCGNGRTGKLCGYMNYGITPDIVTTAKGLGGGLPIGATLLGKKVKDVYKPGMHGSTFGGNPVVCAGALSIIDRIDDTLLRQVVRKSNYIKSELLGASGIVRITGKGLMLGIETKADASEIVTKCRENGVLVLKAKNKVRLLPPLNIPYADLRKAVATIKEVCSK